MANLGVIKNFDLASGRIGCRIQQPAYGLDLHRLCIQVSNPSVPPGGPPVTTDPTNTGATPAAPLQTSVDLPDTVGGAVTITQGVQTVAPPSGYTFLEQQLEISAPPGTVASRSCSRSSWTPRSCRRVASTGSSCSGTAARSSPAPTRRRPCPIRASHHARRRVTATASSSSAPRTRACGRSPFRPSSSRSRASSRRSVAAGTPRARAVPSP